MFKLLVVIIYFSGLFFIFQACVEDNKQYTHIASGVRLKEITLTDGTNCVIMPGGFSPVIDCNWK